MPEGDLKPPGRDPRQATSDGAMRCAARIWTDVHLLVYKRKSAFAAAPFVLQLRSCSYASATS